MLAFSPRQAEGTAAKAQLDHGEFEAMLRVSCRSVRPIATPSRQRRPLVGILTYSVAVTLYLAYLGLTGVLTGALLWPAVLLHLILSVLLGRVGLVSDRRSGKVGDGMGYETPPGSPLVESSLGMA